MCRQRSRSRFSLAAPDLAMTFPRRVQTASAIAILCLWALFLYRPWNAAAVGLVDMPALISAMEGQPDFPARVAALLDMHRAEGRFAPVSMGLMAAGWTWFGGDGAG